LKNLLRPHQLVPVEKLVSTLTAFGSAFDLSDTGTGKTYVAAAVAKRLNVGTLVVSPKIARSSWLRAAAHFNDSFTVIGYEKLRTGRTPFGWWDNSPPPGFEREEFFVCQCCQRQVDFEKFQPCYCSPIGAHCVIIKKRKWNYGKFHFHPGAKLIIFDEVHRCGGIGSLNARMLEAAKGRKILGLSATAACSPLQMSALGYVLDLHSGGSSFYAWARRYGCRKDPAGPGFRWMAGKDKQNAVMRQINESIIPARGVRVRCEDIPGFPKREIQAKLYDLDDGAGQIDRLYAEMSEALTVLDKRSENDSGLAVTTILRARQKIELLKVPIAVELASDYIEKGFSVVVFVNYRQTIEELSKRLNCQAIIDGSPEGVRNRDAVIDSFQRNDIRLILANSEAGGICVSLQDLDGAHPRMGLIMPTYSAVSFKQDLGRLHRDGGKSVAHYRVLLAAGTIEEKIKRALDLKLNNLDCLNDGDFVVDSISESAH